MDSPSAAASFTLLPHTPSHRSSSNPSKAAPPNEHAANPTLCAAPNNDGLKSFSTNPQPTPIQTAAITTIITPATKFFRCGHTSSNSRHKTAEYHSENEQ